MERKQEYQDERWKARAAQIRELDHHQCAMCGAKDVELHVHHLSYPPPPFHIWDADDSELVTLCKDCHEKIHDCSTRPTLSEDRQLTTVIICTDENGERMVGKSLYAELCKRGYNGRPYTQQIKDWFREEHWLEVGAYVHSIYEKYADGRERDRASGFNYQPMVFQIRASCSNLGDETESYGEAEIEAIRMALNFI